jgi:ABC-2 type transport system permease protein
MSLSRAWKVLRKDLALGPRSPIFLYAIILPIVLTLVLQIAFGSLFAPKPRLAIVDDGASSIPAAVRETAGIELTMLTDERRLREGVEANDFDAGLVLPSGFDEAVRAGERPVLDLYIGGESLASNRIVVLVTTLDILREVEGAAPPVTVDVVDLGEAGLPMSLRLIPVIMMYALFIAGAFVPASSLVEEKESGTLSALLVTPLRTSEVLVAKGALGLLLAFVMAVMTLVLNDALGGRPAELVLVLFVAAGFSAMLGLVIGTASRDSAGLFTLVKSSGIVLFGPVAFYLFPEWPQWVARLFPTYWAIDPIWQVGVLGRGLGYGEGLEAVWLKLVIALVLSVALVPVVGALSRRMERQIGGG